MDSRHQRSATITEGVLDLTPFVASHVRNLYDQLDGKPLSEPKMFERYGVVAMADISGYSSLTSTLAARGNEGAELLTKNLNPYFQYMIDIIEKSGGDIVKFIGDAILISWEHKAGQQKKWETVAAACSGCLRLLERLGSVQIDIPGDETTTSSSSSTSSLPSTKYELSMHIGLSVGQIYDVHLGTEKHKRMEYFLAGKALRESVNLVNVAQKKEVAVTSEVLSILNNFADEQYYDIEVEGRQGGIIIKSMKKKASSHDGLTEEQKETVVYRPTARGAPKNPPKRFVYQRYINECLLQRLLATSSTHTDYLTATNELRKVSIMFVKIDGHEWHSLQALKPLQAAMELVQDTLKTYEGSLRQMVMDDKGVTFLTVFGLPPMSHENNSIFAVRAAMTIQKTMPSIVPNYSIAVTSGTVFTGVIGWRTRCDHTVMGDVVNLSARMMCHSLSKNEIIVDPATQKATKDEVEFTKNKPEKFVKNADAIETFTVSRIKRAASKPFAPVNPVAGGEEDVFPRTNLVGREEEIRSIQIVFSQFMEYFEREKAAFPTQEAARLTMRQKGVTNFLYRSNNLATGANPTTPRLIIEGEGGLGKTSLLTYIRDIAFQEGLPVCSAKADEVDASTPYYVYKDILCDIFDIITEHFQTTYKKVTNSSSLDGLSSLSDGRIRMNSSPLSKEATKMKKKTSTLERSKSTHSSILGLFPEVEKRSSDLLEEERRPAFVDKTKAAFSILGLDPKSISLLSPIFPSLSDSKERKVADKPESVADVVIRIINFFTTYVKGLVIILDDVHWMDTSSYKITWIVAKRCPGVFMILGSRPRRDLPNSTSKSRFSQPPNNILSIDEESANIVPNNYEREMKNSIYARIRSVNSTKVLELKGLSKDGVEELIKIHCGMQINSVQDKLLYEIIEKTGGNPLFVEKIASNISGNKSFGVSPAMELYLKGKEGVASIVDAIQWGDDPETALIVQFDRFPPDIQLILRAATIIGQTFTLDVVSQMIDNRLSASSCFEKIKQCPEVSGFIEWDEDEFSENETIYPISFRSALLQKSIYSSMLFQLRQQLHLKVAQIYESFLNEENRGHHLPLIAFHYGQSKDIAKKIESLDQVAGFYVDTECYNEAIISLSKLFELVNIEGERRTEKNPKLKARWATLMGTSLVRIGEWSKGQSYLKSAFEDLHYPFPTSNFQMNTAITKQKFKQNSHWKNRDSPAPQVADQEKIEWMKMVSDALDSYITAMWFIGDRKKSLLCMLMQLNICESVGMEVARKKKMKFGPTEALYAMYLWMDNERSLSMSYFERAKWICEYNESNSDMEVYHVLRSCMLLSSGRIQEAIESLDLVLNVYQDYGGVANAPSTFIHKTTICLLNGKLEMYRDDLLAVYQMSTDHQDEANVLGSTVCMIQSLILAAPSYPEGVTDVNNWIKSLEEIYETWPDSKTSPFHLINITSTFILYHSYSNPNDAVKYEADFEKGLGMLLTKIQSHMCFSSVISIFIYLLAQHRLYEVRDYKDYNWERKEAIRKVKKALFILKKLLKWWSFANPIIQFAQGLIYLFENKIRSAERSWRRGVERVNEISDDLEFLKAVLQVRILKYCPRKSKDLQSMKSKTVEFLEEVGARAELAFLNQEPFSLQSCNNTLDISPFSELL